MLFVLALAWLFDVISWDKIKVILAYVFVFAWIFAVLALFFSPIFKNSRISNTLSSFWRRSIILITYVLFLYVNDPIFTFFHELPAQRGNVDAQFSLGLEHFNNRRYSQKQVYSDFKKALKWFKKAGQMGHVRSQYYLGWMHANAQGVPRDDQEAFRWYALSGLQGNAKAQYKLGWIYSNGLGVTQSHQDAYYWYQLAAKQGVAMAQYSLGIMYENGQGVAQDDQQAFHWFQKAANKDHQLIAQYKLWQMYDKGIGVPKDNIRASDWLSKAATDTYATNTRYLFFTTPFFTTMNAYDFAYPEAQYKLALSGKSSNDLQLLYKAAIQGHAKAQFSLGKEFKNNKRLQDNYDDHQAFSWFLRAAEQGHVQAQKYIIDFFDKEQHELSWVLEKNIPLKKISLLKKKGQQGDVTIQYRLGLMYKLGLGVPQNYIESQKWFHMAVKQGDTKAKKEIKSMGPIFPENIMHNHVAYQGDRNAQMYLGLEYFRRGARDPQFYKLALEMFYSLAKQGNAEAQNQLGMMYKLGLGVPQNYKEAIKWFRLAAELWKKPDRKSNIYGITKAQDNLGAMYKAGFGVPLDLQEARMWFNIVRYRSRK